MLYSLVNDSTGEVLRHEFKATPDFDIPNGCSLVPFVAANKVRSNEDILADYTSLIQAHLDSVAKSRGYAGILSLCSYANSTNPVFAAEAAAGMLWRDKVWLFAHSIRDDVLTGKRTTPNATSLISELPTINWPA